MKSLTKRLLYVFAALLIFPACSSTQTAVLGSYKDPALTMGMYKKIFVASVGSNVSTREKVENYISQALTERGFQAVKSLDVFSPDFRASDVKKSDLVMQKIRDTGSDAIVTIALIDQNTDNRYVPGSSYPTSTHSYYHSFGGYYNNWYIPLSEPGYYEDDKSYYVETNLYDAKTEKLVWSAQSKTVNPKNLDSFLKGYKKSMTDQLVKDGLLPVK